METKKFKCKVCGYIHEGNEAPAECPVCKAPASEFEEIKSKKKGLDTGSNSYTMTYMVVIIVIVSLLLSITSGVLKGRQDENVKLDKKKQILSSLPAIDLTKGDAATIYAETVKDFYMLDSEGNIVKELDPVEDFSYKPEEGEYPLYIADVDGNAKVILPVNGAGLWGAIWGYVALDEDRNTVNGVYFSHASETPGLGAEIVTPKFRNPFVGKHLLNADHQFVSIAVMKAGQTAEGMEQVDAISGGTITSKGVETMLLTGLGNYKAFLEKTDFDLFMQVVEETMSEKEAEAVEVTEEVAEDNTMVEPQTEGEN